MIRTSLAIVSRVAARPCCSALLTAMAAAQVDPALFALSRPDLGAIGSSVCVLGDLDADGYPEIAAGAPDTGSVLVFSGRDGSLRQRLTRPGGKLGATVAAVGDVDQDGLVDLAAGDPADAWNGPNAGAVVLWSSRTWQQLWIWRGSYGEAFGSALAAGGDIDRDGHADILVGLPGTASTPTFAGKAIVFSGRLGLQLRTFTGVGASTRFGSAVAPLGDVNADGWPDVAVASPRSASVPASGYVHVFSGRDGVRLRELSPSVLPAGFGQVLAALGDFDRDGAPDLGIASPTAATTLGGMGMIWIYSGATGHQIRLMQASKLDPSGIGSALADLGDLDGDGWPDFAYGASNGAGAVRVVSGATGAALLTRTGAAVGDAFGSALARSPDLNGDGAADLVAGAPGAKQVVALSALPLSFRGAPRAWTATTPRRQDLELDAGRSQALGIYVLLGTKSGTRPGQRFGSVVLPLNPDSYHLLTLFAMNTILFPQVGILDAEGRAKALLAIPVNLPPEFVGATLHHAFALADWRTGLFTYASNAAPLML